MIIEYEKWALTIFIVISMISRSGNSQMPMTSMYGMVQPPLFGMPMTMYGMQPPRPPVIQTVQILADVESDNDDNIKPMSNKMYDKNNQDNNVKGFNDLTRMQAREPPPMPPPMPPHDPPPMPPPMPMGMQMPVPMPMTMQMAGPIRASIPAMTPPSFCQNKPRHKNCPPCPPCLCSPSCTPSFYSYCSSCHKKCRCRSRDETPSPRPAVSSPEYAIPFAPALAHVVVPLGDYYKEKNHVHDTEESEDSASESCEKPEALKKKTTRRRQNFRRLDQSDVDFDGRFVRPEISYIADNGEVKIRRRLSNAEAENLLGEGNNNNELKRQTSHTQQSNSRVNVIAAPSELMIEQEPIAINLNHGPANSDFVPDSIFESIRRKLMNSDVEPETLKSGKKHLVFKPPHDKKISNVSVSFMVT